MAAIQELQKQYQAEFESEAYIEDLYVELNPWEEFIITNLHEVEKQGKLRGPRGIDIGCGPVLHRMAVLSRFCDVIVASDFTQANLDYVTKWLKTEDLDQGHKNIFKLLAKLEGYKNAEDGAKILQARVVAKVQHVIPCNVMQAQPISEADLPDRLFDVAVSNGCIESACLTYADFVIALRNVGTLLKPGAAFYLSGYPSTDFYIIGGKRFELFNFNEEICRKGLQEAGFEVELLEVFAPTDVTQKMVEMSNSNECFFSLSYKL